MRATSAAREVGLKQPGDGAVSGPEGGGCEGRWRFVIFEICFKTTQGLSHGNSAEGLWVPM